MTDKVSPGAWASVCECGCLLCGWVVTDGGVLLVLSSTHSPPRWCYHCVQYGAAHPCHKIQVGPGHNQDMSIQQVVGLGGTPKQQRGVLLSPVSGLLSLMADCSEPWVHLTTGWDWMGYASPTLPITATLPDCLSPLQLCHPNTVRSAALPRLLCEYLQPWKHACRHRASLPGKLLARVTHCPGCLMFHRHGQTGRRDRPILARACPNVHEIY